MFANYLIGLREGLEASLVVGILVAYLVRTGRRERLAPVWAGVGVAVAASLGVGAALTFTQHSLSFEAQEGFGGVMSLIAVAFVTWMIFWMRRQSRFLKAELQHKVDLAVTGGALTLALMAFLAVGREGLETALFLWPALQASGSGAGPALGAVTGLLTSVVIGWLIYRRSVNLNLATFFKVTGAGLVVVAAGVLAYGLHDLQEAAILPGLHNLAFDVSSTIPPSSWYGTLLKGVFNFSPETTWLQAVAWIGYVVPTMVLFFRPHGQRSRADAGSSSTPTAHRDAVPVA
ncbi:MAG: FTR1 family protein [Actinobacteria bacterium]|nr:FTR1 family protein [Actinomycetota bacterium]